MRRLILSIFVLSLALMLVSCGEDKEKSPPTPNVTFTPTEEPFPAPDFTLNAVDGTSYTLSAQQGKWVLLNFWATWCKPCVEEMPGLQTLAETYPDQLLVLGVNIREDKEVIQAFLTDNNITYPVLLTPLGAAEDQVILNYQSTSLPQTVLINPEGKVVWRQFGPLEFATFKVDLERFMKNPS